MKNESVTNWRKADRQTGVSELRAATEYWI